LPTFSVDRRNYALGCFVCNASGVRETSPNRSGDTMKKTSPFADPDLPGLPMSVAELIRCGGVMQLERDAAEKAIAQERRFWLQSLEAWLEQCDSKDDWYEIAYLTGEIRRLRRLLGVSPSLEQRRAQNRARVQRWRARQPGKKDIDGKAARR
jgi:hypothetical protein